MLSTGRAAARQAVRSAKAGRLCAIAPAVAAPSPSRPVDFSTSSSSASKVASTSRASYSAHKSYHTSAAAAANQSGQRPVPAEPTPHVNIRMTPAAAESVESVQQWLQNAFPTLSFPNDVALQMITHESWDHGEVAGHNRRLAFLGRRAMKFYMSLFLMKASEARSRGSGSADGIVHTSERIDALVHTSMLGDHVGRALGLAEVMRWTPAISDGQVSAKETGLFKIRGVAVEALLGAVYHQHGAQAAQSFFKARILPKLATFNEAEAEHLESAIDQAAQEGEQALQSTAAAQAGASSVQASTSAYTASRSPQSVKFASSSAEDSSSSDGSIADGRATTAARQARRRSGSVGATPASLGIKEDTSTSGQSAHTNV